MAFVSYSVLFAIANRSASNLPHVKFIVKVLEPGSTATGNRAIYPYFHMDLTISYRDTRKSISNHVPIVILLLRFEDSRYRLHHIDDSHGIGIAFALAFPVSHISMTPVVSRKGSYRPKVSLYQPALISMVSMLALTVAAVH